MLIPSRVALGVTLFLTGCTSNGLSWKVHRVHTLAEIGGKTYVLAPARPALLGTAEFQGFADIAESRVRSHQAIRRPFEELGKTDLVFILDYGATAETEWFTFPEYGPVFRQPPISAKDPRRSPELIGGVVGFGMGKVISYPLHVRLLVFDGRNLTGGKPVQLYEGEAHTDGYEGDFSAGIALGIEALFADFPGKSGNTTQKSFTTPPHKHGSSLPPEPQNPGASP